MTKINRENNSEKKPPSGTLKLVGLVVGVIIVIFLLLVTFATFNNRKKNAKPEDFMTGMKNETTPANPLSKEESAKLVNQNNTPDMGKTETLSGAVASNSARTYTPDELRVMTKEERDSVLKNTVNNAQEATPDKVLTEDQKLNELMKLPFDPSKIATKMEFANYEKKINKMADRAFLLWLQCTYKGRVYMITVPSLVWNDLGDEGIVPVSIEYFVDTQNKENIVSMKVRDDFRSLATP